MSFFAGSARIGQHLNLSRIIAAFFALLAVSFSASLASAQAVTDVRMVQLNEVTNEITLRNFGTTGVDVSTYWFCRAPGTYQQLSTVPMTGGTDLNLSPNEEVTLVYNQILAAGTGIGLYVSTGFGVSANMADYMQFGGVAGFREPIAVGANLWTAGTFAAGTSGPYIYTGDVDDVGAAFWTNQAAAPVPGLGGWGAMLTVTAMIAVGGLLTRQRQTSALGRSIG